MSDPNDFVIENGVLKKYVGPGGDVAVPEGVTSIGENLFYGCGSLTSITLPEGLTIIGDSAFCFCVGLTSVTLPDSIQVIGKDAFHYCKQLKQIHIPHPQTLEIGESAFTQCDGLVDDTGLLIIAGRVFSFHSARGEKRRAVIPDGVKQIERHAFDCGPIDLEMSLNCPAWQTYGEASPYGFAESVINRSGSTITFRGSDGKTAAYVVLACEGETTPRKNGAILSIRSKDGAFDFSGYDKHFAKLEKPMNKLRVALARIEYPYALSAEMAGVYRNYLKRQLADAGTILIDENKIELLNKLDRQGVLAFASVQKLLDYAKSKQNAEMTAWLLNYQNQHGQGKKAADRKLRLDSALPEASEADARTTEELNRLFRYQSFNRNQLMITEYLGDESCVIIPKAIGGKIVAGIDAMAFEDNPNRRGVIREIIVPGTANYLQDWAFYGLHDVEIHLQEGITRLKKDVFSKQYATTVHIPQSVTDIGNPLNSVDADFMTLVVPKGSYAEQYCQLYQLNHVVTEPAGDLSGQTKPGKTKPAKTKPEKLWKKPKAGTHLIARFLGKDKHLVYPTEVEGIAISGIANTAGPAPLNYKKLASVVLPEGYTYIGKNAFAGCLNLETITLPKTVTEIGAHAFASCKKLKELVLHKGISYSGKNIFSDAEIGTVVMETGQAKIPPHLFFGCRIQNLVICGGDFKSNGNVFDYTGTVAGTDFAQRLYQGNFPQNVYLNGRFRTLDLKGTGGENANKIHPLSEFDESVLLDAWARERIAKEKQNRPAEKEAEKTVQTATVDEILFAGSSFVLTGFDRKPEEELRNAIEQRSGTVISAVSETTNYLIVPDMEITHTAATKKACKLREQGLPVRILRESECRKHMFRHDEKLFGAAGAALARDYQLAIRGKKITLVRYLGSAGNLEIPDRIGDFSVTAIGPHFMSDHGRDLLRRLTVSGAIKKIPDSAFICCSELQEVRLAQGVQTIGRDAFHSCQKLKDAPIPDTVTRIESNAFGGCKHLLNIHIPASVQAIDPSSFMGCEGLERITVDARNQTYDSRNGCSAIIETATNTLIVGCSKTTIPPDVVEIGAYAFADQTELREITIPEGVVSIQKWAFRGCSHLEKVTLPESLRRIGPAAFEWCNNLEEITLPSNLEELHGNTFANCEKLKSIHVPREVIEKYRAMLNA